MSDPPRRYVHDVQSLNPEFIRRSSHPTRETDPMPASTTSPEGASDSDTNTALILKKLEGLASADLLRTMQGQMVRDKQAIMDALNSLRVETRTEVASLRASNDTTNLALNAVSERVKKIESRSMPPRMSPIPRAYDLTTTAPGQVEKLVERLNELEGDLHGVLAERDDAKKEAFLAQERQGAVQKYADDKEREAKEAKEKSDTAIEKAERDKEKAARKAEEEAAKKEAAATKKLDRVILLAKLLAAAIPLAVAAAHFLH